MSRTIAVLSIALIFSACFPQKSVGEMPTEPSSSQLPELKTGLKIKTSPTRGTRLADSLGSEYFIVHVTNTITNDSIIPIRLQIDVPSEFKHPVSGGNVNFKIILWPEVTEPPHLYLDNQSLVQVMENWTISDWEVPNQFDKLLAPGEKYVVTIGTLVDTSVPNICSAVAYSFLTHSERRDHTDCDWMLNEEQSANPQSVLGLRVGFCTSGLHYEACTIITCGQITYN